VSAPDTRRIGDNKVLLAGDLWMRVQGKRDRTCSGCGDRIPATEERYTPASCSRRVVRQAIGRVGRLCSRCVAKRLASAGRSEAA
jgi:hypothetical protein